MLFFHFGFCVFPGVELGLEGGKSVRCLWSEMMQQGGRADAPMPGAEFLPAAPGKAQALQKGSVHGGREPVLGGVKRNTLVKPRARSF